MLRRVFLSLKSEFFVVVTSLVCVTLSTLVVSCSDKETLEGDPAMNPTGGLKSVWPKPDDKLMVGNELKSIFFDTDKAFIRGDQVETLKFNADWLKEHPNTVVQVEGHCDVRGSNAYNLALGEKRAAAAKAYLERLGVEASRVEIVSYGRVPGMGNDVMAKNRRVQFFIIYTD